MKDEMKVENVALGLLALMAFTLPSILLRGWVGASLWRWFILPFVGVEISAIQMSGLWLCFAFMLPRTMNEKKGDSLPLTVLSLTVTSAVFCMIALFVGWIIHAIASR
jgi:hypothetical protein